MNYNVLKTAIADYVKDRTGLATIDGDGLQEILLAIVNSVGVGYTFMGVADLTTNPGNPDQRVWYLAATAGIYANFGMIVLDQYEIAVLKWDTEWHKEVLPDIPSKSQIDERLDEQDAEIDRRMDAQDGRLDGQDARLDGQDEEIADFKDAVQNQVDNYPMITINGNVTNAPDEEDITSIEENGSDVLKFKNRSAVDGMGYVILRKGGDNSFANQVTAANTIYEIRYDFDLGGASVTIPAGCVLHFVGGKLSNGTVVAQGTRFSGDVLFDAILSGTITNEEADVTKFGAKADGVTDDTDAINGCLTSGASTIIFPAGTYLVSTKTSKRLAIQSNTKLIFEEGAVLKAINENQTISSVLLIENKENIEIIGGELYGDGESNTQPWEDCAAHGLSIRHSNNIRVRNLYAHHCHTDGICVLDGVNCRFENCKFSNNRRMGHAITNGRNIALLNCVSELAGMYGYGIEPNYDTDVVKDIYYDSCVAVASSTENDPGCFYFNLSKLKTDNERVAITYSNCVGYNGAFWLGQLQPTAQMRGRILIDNYTSINATSAVFNIGVYDALLSPPIIINNPIIIHNHTLDIAWVYSAFLVALNNSSSVASGNIIINNATFRECENNAKRVIGWDNMKNVVVSGGGFENTAASAGVIDFYGEFPDSVFDISEGGTYYMTERKMNIIANSSADIVFRTGISKGMKTRIFKNGSGSIRVRFIGGQIVNKTGATFGGWISCSAALAYIDLEWVESGKIMCTGISSDNDWSFA